MSVEAGVTGRTATGVFRARVAVSALFFVFGINIGTWAAHIPVVQARLDINPALLGLALLCSAAGTIIAQPALGVLMARFGSYWPGAVLPLLASAILPTAVLSPTTPYLFVVAFFVGCFWGGMNVTMNTQASEIETLRGKPTMSSFHACASVGMLAGATLTGLLVGNGWSNGEGTLLVAGVEIAAVLVTVPFFIKDKPVDRGPAFVMPSRAVFMLGTLAFLMFLVEGGMVDWSALFLAIEKGADPASAATGFAMFTGAMAIARIFGNQVITRIGRWPTVVAGGGLVVVGILAAIASPTALLAGFGFAIVGIGAANVVPILISAAAQTPGTSPSVSIGAVATMMTLGFLVGPPLIGFVSNASSLSLGLSLIAVAGVIVAIAALLQLRRASAG